MKLKWKTPYADLSGASYCEKCAGWYEDERNRECDECQQTVAYDVIDKEKTLRIKEEEFKKEQKALKNEQKKMEAEKKALEAERAALEEEKKILKEVREKFEREMVDKSGLNVLME